MKSSIRRFCLAALLCGAILSPLTEQADTPTVTTFARLGGTPDGYRPRSAPVQGPDGNFYGTTEAGGSTNGGTIYRLTPDGTFTTIYTFKDQGDSANPPDGLTVGPDGNFYGVTQAAFDGSAQGTVFRFTLAGGLTTLYRFGAVDKQSANADGANPQAALLLGSDGNLYGTTVKGGTTGNGTVFKITPKGKLTSLHSFTHTSSTDFFGPRTKLAEGADGNFYGTAHQSDIFLSQYSTDYGVLFKMTPAGVVTLFHAFHGADGAAPGPLVRGTDGNFYGTTAGAFLMGRGLYMVRAADSTVFQITPDGVLTTLYDFTTGSRDVRSSAAAPSLIQGADGNFYGAASDGSATTSNSFIFRLTPTGEITVLYSFALTPTDPSNPSVGTYPDGIQPTGVTQGSDGNFYGVTVFGGSLNSAGGDTGGGTVFRLTPTGELTTSFRFVVGGSGAAGGLLEAADGSFYGATASGGALAQGTLFHVTSTGAVATFHDFNRPTDGSTPNDGPVRGKDGTLYGTTEYSPDDGTATGHINGGIYAASADGTVRSVYSFQGTPTDGPDGAAVSPGLLVSADGTLLYGTTRLGGANGGGTVFSFNPATGEEKIIHSFAYGPPLEYYIESSDGIDPNGGLVASADGTLLYGTTGRGGSYGVGTVFSLDPVTGDEKTLHSFGLRADDGGEDGAYPAGLTLGRDGALYGTTSEDSGALGGPGGTVFRITPAGFLTTLHSFTYDEGGGSAAPLLQADDGNFYGTAGSNVFSLTPDGSFTTLGHPGGSRGLLIQAADGNLYGVTDGVGTDGAGAIFRVGLNPVVIPPNVTLSAATPEITLGSGDIGQCLLTLDHAYGHDLYVAYTVKGSATPGTNYAALKGTAKIKAGKTSKVIKIVPLGDLGGAGKRVVKLTLAPGEGYTADTVGFVKVTILPPEQ